LAKEGVTKNERGASARRFLETAQRTALAKERGPIFKDDPDPAGEGSNPDESGRTRAVGGSDAHGHVIGA